MLVQRPGKQNLFLSVILLIVSCLKLSSLKMVSNHPIEVYSSQSIVANALSTWRTEVPDVRFTSAQSPRYVVGDLHAYMVVYLSHLGIKAPYSLIWNFPPWPRSWSSVPCSWFRSQSWSRKCWSALVCRTKSRTVRQRTYAAHILRHWRVDKVDFVQIQISSLHVHVVPFMKSPFCLLMKPTCLHGWLILEFICFISFIFGCMGRRTKAGQPLHQHSLLAFQAIQSVTASDSVFFSAQYTTTQATSRGS